MIIKEEIFVPKELVKEKIDLLVENLTTIKDDNGEFLLDFDGLKVDDKSWTVWNWPQGVGLYGIYKNYQMTKILALIKWSMNGLRIVWKKALRPKTSIQWHRY